MHKRLVRDEFGAMLAEYALMLAVFAMGCVCTLYFFSHAISKALSDAADLIAVVSQT